MSIDAAKKAVVTIMAACLLWFAFESPSLLTPVQAQTSSPLGAQVAETTVTTDVVALMGKRRSEMTAVFPGTQTVIRPWNDWVRVFLLFNRSGLVTVILEPFAPITERQADDAIQRLGVSVEPDNYFVGADERGYSDMGGPIRSVIYRLEADKVRSIGIFSRLADND